MAHPYVRPRELTMAPRLTDDDRATIRRLHGEGKSLRSIAEALGRSAAAIAKVAADLGLSFDRSRTAEATKAKVQDNRARRAALVASLYDIAEDDVAYLRQAASYNLTEVSAGQVVDYAVERLPAQDRRALISAISTAAQSAVRLEQTDSDESGLPAVDQWLRSMLGGD